MKLALQLLSLTILLVGPSTTYAGYDGPWSTIKATKTATHRTTTHTQVPDLTVTSYQLTTVTKTINNPPPPLPRPPVLKRKPGPPFTLWRDDGFFKFDIPFEIRGKVYDPLRWKNGQGLMKAIDKYCSTPSIFWIGSILDVNIDHTDGWDYHAKGGTLGYCSMLEIAICAAGGCRFGDVDGSI